ncbi:unnamed protein product [Arctia plantaginis]|uniref:Beta-1,4-N-acetylgalactosaminyltransferase n=1 Tax=Arctia plantaginis TaxID=874455 RepID=A0A8S1B2G1_ARCPL|nr:unnamed protein product [Arctia plantaginis]
MRNEMARLKVNRFKYSSLLGRDRRSRSLQECLENKREFRRSYKNWILVGFMLMCLHFMYQYFNLSDGRLEYVTESTPFLMDPGDELLTTKKRKQSTPALEEFPNFYRLDSILRLDSTTTVSSAMPKCIDHKNSGTYPLNITKVELTELASDFPMVQSGGYYRPPNCASKQKIAIVVAFRSRDTNLAIFLANIHPFLMIQQLQYQIFVIEQSGIGIFNKGRLYNVGYKEVNKLNKFECIIFHDVDLLPMNLEIQYGCPTLPRHMSAFVNDTEIKKSGLEYKFKSLFGGVVSLTMEMIMRTNGYSNVYFGWGGEDNDMLWRLRAVGYPIVRYNKSIGVYLVMPHTRAPVNEFRHHLLATGLDRYKKDGLSNLQYEVVSISRFHLYTLIVADINPRKENISMWASDSKLKPPPKYAWNVTIAIPALKAPQELGTREENTTTGLNKSAFSPPIHEKEASNSGSYPSSTTCMHGWL